MSMVKGRVTEIFYSFQGEGHLVGARQIFLRFFGCPLSCSYCDTRPTQYKVMDSVEVVNMIKELASPNLVHSVAVTGGEPLYQIDFLEDVAYTLVSEGYSLFLETSGYPYLAYLRVRDKFQWFSVDIKMPEFLKVGWEIVYKNELKVIHDAYRERPEGLIVKTVISPRQSLEEYEEIVLKKIPATRLVIQPVWQENSDFEFGYLWEISELAQSYGFDVRVLPQVHKLFGWR